ncbi:MAG: hypothetical protein U5L04_12995 [Trueperaceae bacterium]|nr:hypothetical protein [Trueperaceae bacterium]
MATPPHIALRTRRTVPNKKIVGYILLLVLFAACAPGPREDPELVAPSPVRPSPPQVVTPPTYPTVIYRFAREYPTNRRDVVFLVDRVEILPNDRMRWYVGFFNRSNSNYRVGFDTGRSYLTDEAGNAYPLLDSSYVTNESLRAGVRRDYWLELPAPRGQADEFTVRLFSDSSAVFSAVTVPTFELTLPEAD